MNLRSADHIVAQIAHTSPSSSIVTEISAGSDEFSLSVTIPSIAFIQAIIGIVRHRHIVTAYLISRSRGLPDALAPESPQSGECIFVVHREFLVKPVPYLISFITALRHASSIVLRYFNLPSP